MSILDMDVTTRRDPGSIRSRPFATVRKGYDPDQVRSYLDQVASWMDDLENDLADARAEIALRATAVEQARTPASLAPDAGADPYAALGARVAELLRTAEEYAERTRQEAEDAAQRLLDEARQESVRLRTSAQQEAEATRVSAREQAEAARHAAQEEADRVRDEAASALETARVEAERTVASLSERRSALAAELHATRSRLVAIVAQLEEEQEAEDAVVEPPMEWLPAVPAGSIPQDDPRRDPVPLENVRHDPVPPEIPAFTPPTPPRIAIPDSPSATAVQATGTADVEMVADGRGGAESTVEMADQSTLAPPNGDDDVGTSPTELAPEELAVHEPAAPEAITSTSSDGEPAPVPDDPDMRAVAEEDIRAAREEAAGGAKEEAADEDRPSFLQWTPEEVHGPEPIDLSLPDFPSIDIPTLEEEEDRRQ
jgi:DivIVA domain-containing protein